MAVVLDPHKKEKKKHKFKIFSGRKSWWVLVGCMHVLV